MSTNRITANPVEISSINRSYSDTWDSGVGCGTMMHEVLHLTGLVDCYQEKSITKTYDPSWWPYSTDETTIAYNCRNVRNDTIMANHNEIMGGYKTQIYQCHSASCSSRPFRATYSLNGDDFVMVPSRPDADYSDSSNNSQTFAQNTEKTISEWMTAGRAWSNEGRGYVLFIQERPTQSRFLTDGEFNFITRPQCSRDNKYFACSANAYRTREIEGCIKVPGGCN